jgi:transcriptional regulator with XRE-family HTH domain
MDENSTLGNYLRAERERRELTLRTISENTKVSLPLLEGLESDDISRWPGGIFRRAFVRSYAEAVGLDPDDVYRRFEQQYKPPAPEIPLHDPRFGATEVSVLEQGLGRRGGPGTSFLSPDRARYLGTAADLMVAAILAFGSAAAGSRLLWPVLLIAAYYAAGILLTGTSPMVALLAWSGERDTAEAPLARPFVPSVDHVEIDDVNVDPILDHSSARSAT